MAFWFFTHKNRPVVLQKQVPTTKIYAKALTTPSLQTKNQAQVRWRDAARRDILFPLAVPANINTNPSTKPTQDFKEATYPKNKILLEKIATLAWYSSTALPAQPAGII